MSSKPNLKRDCYYCHTPMELVYHFFNNFFLFEVAGEAGYWDFVCPKCGTKEDLFGTIRMKGLKA